MMPCMGRLLEYSSALIGKPIGGKVPATALTLSIVPLAERRMLHCFQSCDLRAGGSPRNETGPRILFRGEFTTERNNEGETVGSRDCGRRVHDAGACGLLDRARRAERYLPASSRPSRPTPSSSSSATRPTRSAQKLKRNLRSSANANDRSSGFESLRFAIPRPPARVASEFLSPCGRRPNDQASHPRARSLLGRALHRLFALFNHDDPIDMDVILGTVHEALCSALHRPNDPAV